MAGYLADRGSGIHPTWRQASQVVRFPARNAVSPAIQNFQKSFGKVPNTQLDIGIIGPARWSRQTLTLVGRGSPDPARMIDRRSPGHSHEGDLRSGVSAGSGDPRRTSAGGRCSFSIWLWKIQAGGDNRGVREGARSSCGWQIGPLCDSQRSPRFQDGSAAIAAVSSAEERIGSVRGPGRVC